MDGPGATQCNTWIRRGPMNVIVYLMIGIPGSGKSVLSKKIRNKGTNFIILSSDDIREELSGTIRFNASNNQRVFEVLDARLKKSIEDGYDVIVDATNLDEIYRRSYIEIAHSLDAQVFGIVVNTSFVNCLKNNSNRKYDSRVPYKAMIRMQSKFTNTILDLEDLDGAYFVDRPADLDKICNIKQTCGSVKNKTAIPQKNTKTNIIQFPRKN